MGCMTIDISNITNIINITLGTALSKQLGGIFVRLDIEV